MPRESGVEFYLRDELRSRGGNAIKLTGYRGIPDRLPILNGHAVFAETKTPVTDLEKAQIIWHRNLAKIGFNVWVPRTRADVRQLISYMERLP